MRDFGCSEDWKLGRLEAWFKNSFYFHGIVTK